MFTIWVACGWHLVSWRHVTDCTMFHAVVSLEAIWPKVSNICSALKPWVMKAKKKCQNDKITNRNSFWARCCISSPSPVHFVFRCPCQSSNCSSIWDYWGAEVCGGAFLFTLRAADCTPMESRKSVKTIIFSRTTEVFLADCREQGPGKVRKSIMCVHLCVSLKQTLTACRTAWPCWHFIFHLASSINHSTRIKYNARGHPSLLALIIPLCKKIYSQKRNWGRVRARRRP